MNRLLLFLCLIVCRTGYAQTVSLTFTHVVGQQPLRLNKQSYYTASGDTFTISTFKYYLSNFSFIKENGEVVKLGPEYFLISEDSAASKMIAMGGLPAGEYKAITFMIGVDSIMNCTGAQAGALDPMYGMFWTWNSGYIMAKLEGHSPASHLPDHLLEFHIGGYRTHHQTQRMVTLPVALHIVEGKNPVISLVADAGTWFGAPNPIHFSETAGFMAPGTIGDKIADNYSQMFSVKRVIY